METKNAIKLVLLFLAILFLIEFAYVTNKIEEILDTITGIEQKLETIQEDQAATQGILNAHLTNTLSLDMEGEE